MTPLSRARAGGAGVVFDAFFLRILVVWFACMLTISLRLPRLARNPGPA